MLWQGNFEIGCKAMVRRPKCTFQRGTQVRWLLWVCCSKISIISTRTFHDGMLALWPIWPRCLRERVPSTTLRLEYACFREAVSFIQSLASWNVSRVHFMPYTFASSFNQPLNTWKVHSVITIERAFHVAVSFNQPLAAYGALLVIKKLVEHESWRRYFRTLILSIRQWKIGAWVKSHTQMTCLQMPYHSIDR